MKNGYFDAEHLKQLRDQTRQFVKIDVGYMLAAGAIITALKIGKSDLLWIGAKFIWPAISILVLVAIDAFIDWLVFREWILSIEDDAKKISKKVFGYIFAAQYMIHIGFLAGIVSYVAGFSAGAYSVIDRVDAMATIQEGVDRYVAEHGAAPHEISSLDRRDSLVSALAVLGNEQVSVFPKEGGSYEIRFGGEDKRLGTSDDETFSDKISIRDLYKKLVRGCSEESKRAETPN